MKRIFWLVAVSLLATTVYYAVSWAEEPQPSNTPAAQNQPPAEQPPEKKAEEKPPAGAEEKPAEDPFAVPEGTPKELVEYIQKLVKRQFRDDKERMKAREAILKAAEKILSAEGTVGEAELEFAVQAKMNMLADLKKLEAFAEELHTSGREKLARMVRRFALQIQLRTAMAVGSANAGELVKQALEFLGAAPLEPMDVPLAYMAGHVAEQSGNQTLAVDTYRTLSEMFSESKDPKMQEFAEMLTGVTRRLTLPGNEIKIEGKLLGGEPFDWSKYAGKVVLVDFWATWCGPCLAEIPKLLKYYEAYHEKGFEIIGISCDQRLSDLEKFIDERKIPWPIVYGDDKPSPTVQYYGVMSIPTMILVGRDGKVISITARGPILKAELAKIFGPIEEKPKEDNKEQPSSDKK